jgi:hypothetical protein
MRIWRRSTRTPRLGPKSISTSLRAAVFLFLLGLATAIPGSRAEAGPDRSSLQAEYQRLQSENAALRARLSLSKDPNTYLVADLGERKLELELQGVVLTSMPITTVRLNRHAERLLAGDERARFLEAPFVLAEDRWFEISRTLALKDSAAVRSRPDTTGALMEAIRTQPVTALLNYDRRLTVVLDGKPAMTRWQRFRQRITTWLESWSSGTLAGILRRESADEVMVTLEMSPPEVRSLAPTLLEGTKLILIF